MMESRKGLLKRKIPRQIDMLQRFVELNSGGTIIGRHIALMLETMTALYGPSVWEGFGQIQQTRTERLYRICECGKDAIKSEESDYYCQECLDKYQKIDREIDESENN